MKEEKIKVSELGLSPDDEFKLMYCISRWWAQEVKLIDRDSIFLGKTISGIE